ncbi:hypothetical protein [Paracoccus solventivorans]|uniref:hypothetical protein n=1 Tax=Paracoccus solventivorans TaxID=53463 RepID=UPI0026F1871C|nr:hypothetical protein [Paracoccus solventivorans]
MTVLCMGEALVDLVPQQDGSIRPQPGGGAWNTALALGRLGVRPALPGRSRATLMGRCCWARWPRPGSRPRSAPAATAPPRWREST